jgi:hypothetical protein
MPYVALKARFRGWVMAIPLADDGQVHDVRVVLGTA